ncbi:transcriptional regulator [Cupriavidus sp. 30B13]|uniref:transcriptional regulator n=1 Tax=Cupriavidus sp. 30B13 TaxID=3384241 RepID=UPI003B909159
MLASRERGAAAEDNVQDRAHDRAQIAISRHCLDAYLGSYVGMEGNPAADLWFCDVRSNGEPVPLASMLSPVAAPLVWDAAFRQRQRELLARWATQQKIARIAAAVRNTLGSVAPCEAQAYFERHLYGPSGWEFKLTLFPLPTGESGARSWTRVYGNQPALNPQERYLDLCREGSRFRAIGALRRQRQPKVIVCLGTRNTEDFLRAFGFGEARQRQHVLQPADQGKPIQVYADGPTTLLVCPPLSGASGLNSDVLQTALGRFIAGFM